jgi:hypothetical protein
MEDIVAKYSYNELRQAAISGRRIGGWNNQNVYACSKYDYDATKTHYYVLYDDGNKLVGQGYCVGKISETGMVTEHAKEWYNVPLKRGDKVTKSVPATSGYSSEVITDDFFRKLDEEINVLLAGVESLKLDMGELKI